MIKKNIAAAARTNTKVTLAERYNTPEIAHILDGTTLWTMRSNFTGAWYTKSEKSYAKEGFSYITGYMVLAVDNPSWSRLTDAEYAAATAFVTTTTLTVADVMVAGRIDKSQFPKGVRVAVVNPRYLHAR